MAPISTAKTIIFVIPYRYNLKVRTKSTISNKKFRFERRKISSELYFIRKLNKCLFYYPQIYHYCIPRRQHGANNI